MKKIGLAFGLIAIITFACSKKDDAVTPTSTFEEIHCETSNMCVQNTGADTIMYCWGCSWWPDTLLPGATICIDGGPVHITETSESYSIHTFSSDHGNIGITMNACDVTEQIN